MAWGVVNRRYLVLGITFLISLNLYSAVDQIEFDRYTTNDGLSNGYIINMVQDSRGFMWFCTANGLNRFDGITFKTYYYDSKDSSSIPNNWVNTIIEDSAGNIWIGTINGLCTYNRDKDNFSRKKITINHHIEDSPNITFFFIDHNSFLWLSTASGLIRINLRNSNFLNPTINAEIFKLDEPDVGYAYLQQNMEIIEDHDEKIWAVSNCKNLFFFNNEENKFIQYSINHPEVDNFSNKTKTIKIDKDGDFYIAIQNYGLLLWERGKDQFTLFKSDNSNKTPKGRILGSICEDKNGLIWIGDRNSDGLSIFNKKTRLFTFYTQEESNPFSLLTNKINTIFRDNQGAMWIGTIIGINKYSPGKSKFNRYFSIANQPESLSSNNVLCFEESRSGNIWIGTDGGGLNKFDRKTGKFAQYKNDPANPNSLSSNAIISICEDHEGTLWMGTYNGGLAEMKNNNFFSYYPNNKPFSISNWHIWYILEDSKNNLWVATLNTGLELFDRKSGRFYNFEYNRDDSTSLCNNSIHGLYEDSRHNLYITTYQGVSILNLNDFNPSKNPPSLHFKNLYHIDNKNSLSYNNVYCVKEDNSGNIWFGTHGSGIDKYDPKTDEFTNYTIKEGLPGNSVYSILVDEENNLWLSTNNGLAKFNQATSVIEVFDRKDGLQNKDLKSWGLKTADGEFFIGGADGFNSFYPNHIISDQNHHKPPVSIIGLTIFNNQIKTGTQIDKKIILEKEISETKELRLNYKESYFTFQFVALDFTSPEKNTYAYKMEGFDKDWVNCGTRREASYTNLDPGEYTFRVKASNNDGLWNEEGTSVKVVILPPWWKTLWFKITAFICIFTLASYIISSRINHLKIEKIELEKLVNVKTAELRHINTLLLKQTQELARSYNLLEERQEEVEAQSEELSVQKDTLEIMNQELNELNATKDKFFSIIAHDIKSPFNSILGFSQLLSENYNEWSDDIKLETINLILSSSKNLFELLENLLQWANSQRGKIEINPEYINLNKVFQHCISVMQGNADTKKILLSTSVESDDLTVFADRLMLDTIIRNLISNEIKFTHTNGKILLSAGKSGNTVKINVTDNGIGIPDDVKNRLFSLASTQSMPGTNNEAGTGLGLIIIQDFVSRHGGTIEINSVVGHGTTFTFTLSSI